MSLSIDLHSHSTISDGVLTPAELVDRAHANGVDVLALTDHDETAGIAEAQERAGKYGIRLVPGIEISVTFESKTVHIVGLGIDFTNTNLNTGIKKLHEGRQSRAIQMAKKFDNLGISGSYEGALKFVSNPALISRTHFARFLVQNGNCANMQQVFDRYLGDHKPADVPVQWASLEQAVSWINGAGGQAVIAHPGRYKYKPAQFRSLFNTFKDLGGVGIEVVTGSHSVDQFKKYAGVARQYQFLASSGSDFHEPAAGRRDLGELPPLPAGLTPIWHDWF